MNLNYGEKSHRQRLSTDADEAEIEALQLGSSTVDSGIQDERIASAMDDFRDNDGEPDWVERDVANDAAVSGIYAELLNRNRILGDSYPFILDGNSIVPKDNHNLLTYKFCLATSYQRNITSVPFTELPRTFELLSQQYSRAHLGPFAESMHTGWPRRPGDPVIFRELANDIHEKTGEWFWQPQAGLDDGDSNHIKDGGIDFIAWVQSPDHRPGRLFVLGQCACGNDWTSKFSDVDIAKLNMWFNPISWVAPLKAFCTPYSLVDGYLYEASTRGGLVYDRIRLAKLSEGSESTLSSEIISSMQRCIELVLNQK